MIILLSKFRVTKISVLYITGENHIGSSFIRQKYFCLLTEIAVLPTEAWNRISGGVTPPPRSSALVPICVPETRFCCLKIYGWDSGQPFVKSPGFLAT
jgi:hypothetical protein